VAIIELFVDIHSLYLGSHISSVHNDQEPPQLRWLSNEYDYGSPPAAIPQNPGEFLWLLVKAWRGRCTIQGRAISEL